MSETNPLHAFRRDIDKVEELYQDRQGGLPPRVMRAILDNREIPTSLDPWLGPKADVRIGHYGAAYGGYAPQTDRIAINQYLQNFPTSMANTMAHEGQHRQYHKTMQGENPRLTQEQYAKLLAGYFSNERTGRKEHTFSPYSLGYGAGPRDKGNPRKRWWPDELYDYEKSKQGGPDPLISNDYPGGYDGFLANFAGIEGMLSPNQKLEDVPLFKKQFPEKKDQDYYHRVSFPMTNWLKESNYPTTKSGKFESQDRSAYPKQRVTNQGLLNKVLEVMGF